MRAVSFLFRIMPSPYIWSGIPAALYYAYYYTNYCGQVPDIHGGEGAFLELLREKCPILKEEYIPPPLIHESRLMTIIASLGRHLGLSYPYMREIFMMSDGGEIVLDWWDSRLKPQSAADIPLLPTSTIAHSLNYYLGYLPAYFSKLRRQPLPATSGEETKQLEGIKEVYDDIKDETDIPLVKRVGNVMNAEEASIFESLPADDLQMGNNRLVKNTIEGVDAREKDEMQMHEEGIREGKGPSYCGKEDEIRIPEPRGIMLILPGLTGDSGQNYVRGLVQVAEQLGLTAVVMNYRGIAGSLKTPKSYCAADTTDVAEVITMLKQRYASVPIIGVGISLGGILLTNYVAQCGRLKMESHLIGVMVVSVAWNIFESCKVLEQPLNWFLFNRLLTRNLCNAVQRHSSMLQSAYDLEALKNVRTIREFDDHLTSKMFGYKGVDDYYKSATLHDKVHFIKTPLLALNAADDMFSPYEAIPKEEAEKNPNVCIVVTSHGGHIGFLEQRNPFGRNYVERLFEQFAKALFAKEECSANLFPQSEEVPLAVSVSDPPDEMIVR